MAKTCVKWAKRHTKRSVEVKRVDTTRSADHSL